MTGTHVLRPLLDALAPEDPAAAGRRVRLAAVWMALSAWLLPEFPGLGTDSVPHRALVCAAFVAAAVAAHFRLRHRWARVGLPVASVAAGSLVMWFGHGAGWGFGFVVFAVLVLAATDLRARFVRIAPPPPEPDPLPPLPGGPARFLNWYAWFGISVLLMWRFVGQGMVVPTGSMQPTIMGAEGRSSSGDHLFVEEFSYLARDPRRWEIVVFQFPLFRERNFVKRVVGLPGEHIEIKDGDLWVNGKIAKKPPIVQATMWEEEFPRAGPFGGRKEIQQGWLQERSGDGGDWKRLGPDEVRGKKDKDGPTWLFCTRKLYGCDVRLSFDVRADSGSAVHARIVSGGRPVEIELPTADSRPTVFAVGRREDFGHTDPLHLGDGGFHHVELTVLDGQCWWAFDGSEKERVDMFPGARGDTRAAIGVSGGEATFRNLRVERDVVYEAAGGPGVYDVPKDGFFFIGDNADHSEDSRKWSVGIFHPPGGGAPVAAKFSVPNELGRDEPNVVERDGMYRFVDVDGVPRELPVAGTKVDRDVPAPFATRSHLIGRAILVFWPWIPSDAGFRPRLLP